MLANRHRFLYSRKAPKSTKAVTVKKGHIRQVIPYVFCGIYDRLISYLRASEKERRRLKDRIEEHP